MEVRTHLLDPQSHSPQRTIWKLDGGLKYLTNKLRVVNFRVLNNSSAPLYFGPRGIYSLCKQIYIENQHGVIIDSLTQFDYLAIKMLHMENSQQESFSRQLFQNMCLSVSVPTEGQVQLTELDHKDDATHIWGYIDIAFALQYLQARNISTDFLTIVIDWQDSLGSWVTGGWSLDRPPALAFDEVLAPLPVDSMATVVFNSVIPDRLFVQKTSAEFTNTVVPAPDETIYRLNAYCEQYIKNLYYFNANPQVTIDADGLSKPIDVTVPLHPNDYYAYATKYEKLEITVDGRKIMPLNGIDTDAKKLHYLDYWTGSFCLPLGASYFYNMTSNGAPYGLYNPNLALKYNGVLSYGCFGLNAFIQSDLTVSYSGPLAGPAASQSAPYTQQVFFMAEVARMYNMVSGTVGNVTMSKPTVNMV